MISIFKNFGFLYNSYMLAILTIGYIFATLGNTLIYVTSKQIAIELKYGDHACQQNDTSLKRTELPTQCISIKNQVKCVALNLNGTHYCEWNYNGLGLDYQLLAGPSFILVFTIVGIVMGIVADKYNRVITLSICTFVFSVAIIAQGSVKHYWQFVVWRMILAAGASGCTPLATGIMSDIFPEKKRALAMGIFSWAIYGGYGIAFPIGRYIPKLNLWNLGWRACYYGTGVLGVLFAILTVTTLKEPDRLVIGEENLNESKQKKVSLWKVLTQRRIIMLVIAASVRQSSGWTYEYNIDLFYNVYFPVVDLGWALFGVTIVFGSVGVVVGGIVSDKIVGKMGTKSRVAVLAISQLIATPFDFAALYFDSFWSMITLGTSFLFAAMWFGILFTVLVEIVPLQVRSTIVGIFLFVLNNVGGNLPILVDPVAKKLGYRESLSIFYAGLCGLSSILFFITIFMMKPPKTDETIRKDTKYDDTEFVKYNNPVAPHPMRSTEAVDNLYNENTNKFYSNGQLNAHLSKRNELSPQTFSNTETSRL